MCTLSWQYRPDPRGYRLFFNRDEQKSRETAEPPAIAELDGTRYIAPRDPRAGGTWMLANQHGVTIALLNHYAADTPSVRPKAPTSRGQLVLEFAACPDVATFRQTVPPRQAAGRYPAFYLFALDRTGASSLWRWDGTDLLEIAHPAPPFLTTSSYRSAQVLAARQSAFENNPGDLDALHAQHDPTDPTVSIRMRRPDAQTVSRSQITATRDQLNFRYTPETIDSLTPGTPLEVGLALS